MITNWAVKNPTPIWMAMRAHTTCAVAALTFAATTRVCAQQSTATISAHSLRMPRIFANGMVLQRDQPITVWGWGTPRSEIVVRLGADAAHGRADAAGAWTVRLAPHRAGGPLRLTVRAGADSLLFSDVLLGDVWVASGQSNMEFQVRLASNAATAIAGARDSSIREFKVPNSWSNQPEDDLAGGGWLPADPAHVGDFSAVAYFFVRHLRPSVSVPIGILNATWGGSAIESWLSRAAQRLSDSAWSAIQQGEAEHDRAMQDSLHAIIGPTLPEVDSGLVNGVARWAEPTLDEHGWSDIRVPAYWEDQGYPGLDGIGWYRTTFALDSNELRQEVTLTLAAVDDDDITWVNGVEVGRTNGYNVVRRYRIPRTLLHAGPNELTVRVADGGGGGGINGAAELQLSNGSRRSLGGTWKFRVGRVVLATDGQRINKIPSVLYNKMVHPILPFAIRGVIWYQGESNANTVKQSSAYREQFATLIQSWRQTLSGGRGAFPFLWVQLPNYMAADDVPQLHPRWALQRESMEAALALPATGRAVTIDLGGADELHPKNKDDVGARLALVARRVAYGEHVDDSGPAIRGVKMHADTAIVSFTRLGGGLRVHGDTLGGFTIAGLDEQFVSASGRIVGDRVYLWSDRVKSPVAVRYAWANNPDRASLYGANGLPAAPFRSDRW